MAAHGSGSHTADGVNRRVSVSEVAGWLSDDSKVRVAGVDADGILRGKIMDKDKFLSSIAGGFGMSSAIFAWDIHDAMFPADTIAGTEIDGFADFVAHPDLSSYRRLPSEDNIPFFLLNFSVDGEPMFACPRNLLRGVCADLAAVGLRARAGVELEFMNFQTPSEDGYQTPRGHANLAAYLENHAPTSLRPITAGMFGYSSTRPITSKQYFHDIYDHAAATGCHIESWHTESGPGVYEAALKVSPAERMADNVSVFKLLAKSLGVEHGITPCFLAKPIHGMPGNSGHIHVSLADQDGNNAFARRGRPDQNAPWPDVAQLSDIGRHFLAGLLAALPDLMPLFAPSVNSYKRLVENFWAPVDVSWGLEDRKANIRLVAPPVSSPAATRFEVRIPGADLHPHYALAAVLAAGLRGIRLGMAIPVPPLRSLPRGQQAEKLPNSLETAVERFRAPESVARELFGDQFVDFYAKTRDHELRLWREAVTDWEFKRYIEVA